MITTLTKLKIIGFLVVGLLVMAYIGNSYADMGKYVGVRDYYEVRVELPSTGGLFTNAEVTYRGVPVGRVGSVDLTDDGVEAVLRIKKSAPDIPTDLRAQVANRSAVGEQYVDLRPETSDGPYLKNGSVITRQEAAVPATPVTTVLSSLDELSTSVPLDSLATVVDEFGDAFAGQGDALQVLLDTSSDFVKSADKALPQTVDLFNDSETVLRTQREESDAFRAFARNAKALAGQLKASDSDVRRVIESAPAAAEQVSGLLRDVDPNLSVLFANLTTTSELFVTRQRGLEELLVKLPQAVASGNSVIGPNGLRLGMSVTFFQPLPCTAGYGGTRYRNGLDTSPGPVNTQARCLSSPGTGKLVRGSANAPRGGVPVPARPGSLLSGDSAAGGGGGGGASRSALPGALGLPSLPPSTPYSGTGSVSTMSALLGLKDGR
ncbi:MlaD family protein [Streptomyces sp. B1866]|uniref:MlaD family protein n=1 Tax=Streptomyces sp. B1866 TaxID=3075431 RepID=UPI00288C8F70|nr:MlaD family protein [Streptomyces sp. B1866]MDT3397037.1 MlaD family protein [Streptomyces sp. B1866]